jgi:putative peptidoglycan lipid II flippase
MNLWKAGGTIGGLTMVSRVLGLAREMLAARVLGASAANEVFQIAFLIPNLFRRLFGEGAFSAGFVPLFSARLGEDGNTEEARRFAEEVMAVFLPMLMAITLLFVVFMPAFIGLMVPDDWGGGDAKTNFAIELTRITMPYLVFICLVSLVSGVLNSLNRFVAAAFAPALLNIALVGALILFPQGGATTARAMAISVTIGGLLQLAICWLSMKRAGLSLRFRMPRITPGVKELFVLVLPATLAGGVYYISQLFYVYFATRLPGTPLVYLGAADRLNQLPLAIIGSALGVAILPSVSRAVATGDPDTGARIQGQAIELGMLLTLPATVALAVASLPIAMVVYEGGRYTAADAATTGMVLAILVLGLPAYVLIKMLTPGFYARKDVRTPVTVAVIMLGAGVALNFALVPVLGLPALPLSTAISAWANAITLYVILHARGHFRVQGWLFGRLVRQLIAAGAMGLTLWVLIRALAHMFAGSTIEKIVALGAIVGAGGIVYFAIAWTIGAMNKEDVLILLRKKKVETPS